MLLKPVTVYFILKQLSFFQPQLASLCATTSRGRPASCHRLVSQQEVLLQQEVDSELHLHPQAQDNLLPSSVPPAARNAAGEDGSRSSTDSPSVGSVGDTGWITSSTSLLKRKCKEWSEYSYTSIKEVKHFKVMSE